VRLPKPTYANVLSTLVVFAVLAGGTAFAAAHLAKNSVGTKQLKKNSVTTKKIKKNAVTKAKIKKNAITSAKIADGAVTAAKIDVASTGFTRKVASLQLSGPLSFDGLEFHLIGSFTQNPGEDVRFLGSADISFAASCEAPRSAQVYLLLDADPAKPQEKDVIGFFELTDEQPVAATVKAAFVEQSSIEPNPSARSGPAGPTTHTLSLFLDSGECVSGEGVAVAGATVDVIGTK